MSGHRIPPTLTQQRLRELLDYDPSTGTFTRRVKTNSNQIVGQVVGSKTSQGYLALGVDGVRCQAHRVVWLYVHGVIPGEIDHINGDRADNRLANLREVSRRENSQNRLKANPKNSTGLIGVTRDGKHFRANIYVDRKRLQLGSFLTAEDAHAAYLAAKRDLHQGWEQNKRPVDAPKRVQRARPIVSRLDEIRALLASGMSQRAVARLLGVTQPPISLALSGRCAK